MLSSAALQFDTGSSTVTERFDSGCVSSKIVRSAARAKWAELQLARGLLTAVPDTDSADTLDLQPRETKTPAFFIPVQEWEGYVEEIIEGEQFLATLVDIRRGVRAPRQSVRMQFSDVTKDDRKLIQPGAVFRWAIGYYDYGGSRNRMSKLVMRRLPNLTLDAQKAARDVAAETKATIRLE